ncbi:hypothetical protein ACM66B_005436 [Microbotryomycetes sp. NB124-2]
MATRASAGARLNGAVPELDNIDTSTTAATELNSSFNLEEDPSFLSGHVYTSTPSKTARAFRPTTAYDARDVLRDSDTESIDADELGADIHTATRLDVGNRTSAQSSNIVNNSVNDASNATLRTARLGSTDARTTQFGRAPSPSTGSSTLVDDWPQPSRVSKRKGVNGRQGQAQAHSRERDGVLAEKDDADDTPVEEDGASSTSPRPFRLRTTRDLSSYIESRSSAIATPPPTTSLRRSLPTVQTPHAPGAFPSRDRQQQSLRRSVPEAGQASSVSRTPTSAPGSGTKQIQDAFHRFIHGPDGALAHSAEKRAALAAVLASAAKSASKRTSPGFRPEPETPHPVGYYGFTPTHSVPVDKTRSQPPGVLAHATSRDASISSEDEIAATHDSPSARARSHNSKLEKTLRHIRELQRETEQTNRRSQAQDYPLQSSPAKPERGVDYEGDYSSSAEDLDQSDCEPAQAQRSAIKFAMARSFALPRDDSVDDLAVQVKRERFVPPPVPPRQSPSKTRRSRQPTPPSPGLPDLPPSPTPESSPVRTRDLLRKSPHSRQHSTQSVQQQPTHSSNRASPSKRPVRRPSPSRNQTRPPAANEIEDADTTSGSLSALVAELASAVKALQDPPNDENGLPVQPETGKDTFTRSLARRDTESERRRRTFQAELHSLDEDARAAMTRRDAVLDKLLEAQSAEASLSSRIEQLRKSVEQIGSQAADAVRDTLQTESRKRTQWFIIAFFIQLYLFICMLRQVLTPVHEAPLQT